MVAVGLIMYVPFMVERQGRVAATQFASASHES